MKEKACGKIAPGKSKAVRIDWIKYVGAWKDVNVERLKKEIKKERR